ncbi:hypothetical protein LAZ40_04930 [Cereibacter sphaeroides]|uniref:hypothetical protein n=1 Tax=Cereibacter sphaeroides TaxID=1063 RepID=UPI001F3FB330|nr:hypothetical protein [Cereibacter sphaeroides]MCE6958400.1 hypothetical protein [Cereibacter sphaeroides]MCE6972267.1 hypothetical protein [Cereibacter sphaeroides]
MTGVTTDPLRLLDALYGAMFRELRPDLPEDAIVYEVDTGKPGMLSTTMRAGVVSDDGRIVGEPVTVVIAKEWMRDWVEAGGRACEPDTEAETGPG